MELSELEQVIAQLRNKERSELISHYKGIVKGGDGLSDVLGSFETMKTLTNLNLASIYRSREGNNFRLTRFGVKVACFLGTQQVAEQERLKNLKKSIMELKSELDKAGLKPNYKKFLNSSWSASTSVKDMEFWQASLLEMCLWYRREAAASVQ